MMVLRVPASLGCRSLVIELVSTGCRLAREELGTTIDDRFVDELTTAVGEAFNNVVIHAHAGDREGSVQIELAADAEEVTVTLTHAGIGFDMDSVPTPEVSELPESGMGLFLIRATVDEVSYQLGDPHRMVLRKLTRHG